MEEKIICQSSRLGWSKKLVLIIAIPILALILIHYGLMYYVANKYGEEYIEQYEEHSKESCFETDGGIIFTGKYYVTKGKYCYYWEDLIKSREKIYKDEFLAGVCVCDEMSAVAYAWNCSSPASFRIIAAALTVPVCVFELFCILLIVSSCFGKMVVTDKKVYGKVAFGKRVDIPLDSISSIAMTRLFQGVSVSSSSGCVRFLLLRNVKEIYDTLNNILSTRQSNSLENCASTLTSNDIPSQLKKYKELLDSNIITQEEFDAMKKQLLNL